MRSLAKTLLVWVAPLTLAAPSVHGDLLPPNAMKYLPTLRVLQEGVWQSSDRAFIARQIHQETCITPAHRYCWSPQARLKTDREEGAGLGQITRAWSKDGSLRFDNLAEGIKQADGRFEGVSWSTIYHRVDFQMWYIINRQAKCFAKWLNLDFCAAIYNSGEGSLKRRLIACSDDSSCDPENWFLGVSRKCGSLTAVIYGRSSCEINNTYVYRVQILIKIKFNYEEHL